MPNIAENNVYLIKQQCFYSYEEGVKALRSQRKMLDKLIKKHECDGFVMGLSECCGGMAQKINLNAGKVGRPKIEFINQNPKQDCRVKPHIHLYIVGHKAATVAREFVERQNKIYYKKYPNSKFKHAFSQEKRSTFRLEYLKNQCNKVWFGGDKEKIMKYVKEWN